GVDEQFMEGLRQLAAGDAAVGLTLGAAPGRLQLALELAAGEQNRLLAGKAFGLSIGASLARARELSKRAASAANLQGIVGAARVYSGEHKGQWPASLAELLQSGDISLETLRNPYDGTAPRMLADAERESYYVYRRNIPKGVAATEVVAGEREIRRGEGANFAYADGHVEFVREPQASRLLAVLQAQSR
ncbi:MAG: H-X9-DG-CTERM domain-containing protein, partial [Planctomycetota bacterium]